VSTTSPPTDPGPATGPEDLAAKIVRRIDEADRSEVWITRVAVDDLTAAVADVARRRDSGEDLPLAGLTFAVKDNIDVAGVPTTAGCPAYATMATATAPAVDALVQAGAVYVGKTNLDQFATGLVGTRSPYGAVRNAVDPTRISGGSSSGSAVAVALGLVDLALGTDTAGSGRVPAALNGIVGIKPTRGLVSTAGVVPACRSFDCVSVFARDVALAERAFAVLAAPGLFDEDRRTVPPTAPLGPPATPVVGRASPEALGDLDPGRRQAYDAAVATLERSGCTMVTVDLAEFLEAGRLLYGGAFLAERYAAVGAWVDDHRDEVDPVVGSIIGSAAGLGAARLAADAEHLGRLASRVDDRMASDGICSMVLPTVSDHPTIADVAADPVGTNARLGTFTQFVNLLDLCAVSVPVQPVDGLPFGVSLIGPAWSDRVQASLARRLDRPTVPSADDVWSRPAFPAVQLVVAGAHLTGQPLNGQLTDRGGRRVRSTATAPCYRLVALHTELPKPGLVRVAARDHGAAIEVEVWELPPVGFASFVAGIPQPMAIGQVELADGTSVPGFLCEPVAVDGARDITAYGGWKAYLQGS
jgi:allophanate hydrolase